MRASVVLCTVQNVELVRPGHHVDPHYPVSHGAGLQSSLPPRAFHMTGKDKENCTYLIGLNSRELQVVHRIIVVL